MRGDTSYKLAVIVFRIEEPLRKRADTPVLRDMNRMLPCNTQKLDDFSESGRSNSGFTVPAARNPMGQSSSQPQSDLFSKTVIKNYD
jgi:hypothetical protein